jgi:ligand-binding sensor domain-containing protein
MTKLALYKPKQSILLLLTMMIGQCLNAQKLGRWRSHLPYSDIKWATEAGDEIWAATPSGLFNLNNDNGEIKTYTTVNGLSDIDVVNVEWNDASKRLLIAYSNTNLDLMEGNQIYHIPDILRTSILGRKAINHIYFYDKYAYISCSFGIVKLNLDKRETTESYQNLGASGNNVSVSATAIYQDTIYAATSEGIISAPLNSPNLADFNLWQHTPAANASRIVVYHNRLYAGIDSALKVYSNGTWGNYSGPQKFIITALNVQHDKLVCVHPDGVPIYDDLGITSLSTGERNINAAVLTATNRVFHCSSWIGFIIKNANGSLDYLFPNGPNSQRSSDFTFDGNQMWMATAGISSTNESLYSNDRFSKFEDGIWFNMNQNDPIINDFRDLWKIAIHPITKKVYVASYGNGLLSYDGSTFQSFIPGKNGCTLDSLRLNSQRKFYIGGLTFDNDANLWITNPGAVKALSVYTKEGKWQSFSLAGNLQANDPLTDIIIDDFNQKWICAPYGKGIIVLKNGENILNNNDISVKQITTEVGNGYLPDNSVNTIAKDLDGNMWVGTAKGLTVFYAAGNIFQQGQNFDAQRIVIVKDKKPAYLLGDLTINHIAVDAGNRKWIATGNGVFLVSADGQQILKNFNKENSPLISDYVNRIGINPLNGEVFFGTDHGLISYQSDAISADDAFGEVYVYPNPVRENFTGDLSIKGLARDAAVKITDISGNLVYETKANGSYATWNCKNFRGERVHTGVYLIFAANSDGSETRVAKVMVVN